MKVTQSNLLKIALVLVLTLWVFQKGSTAMHLAARDGSKEVLQFLIVNGFDKDVRTPVSIDFTPLTIHPCKFYSIENAERCTVVLA